MKLSTYANQLNIPNCLGTAWRYSDTNIPRSRIPLTYSVGKEKLQNYINLLATVLETDARMLFNIGNYYTITRYNSTSCAVSAQTYTTNNVIFYACASHRAYEDAQSYITANGKLLDYSLATAPFTIPNWKIFYGVRDGSGTESIIIVADNNSINQQGLDMVPNMVASMLYNQVQPSLSQKYPEHYIEFAPENVWDTYGIDEDNDQIFASEEFDVPAFLANNLEQVLAQRQAEEEARRLREEEERLRKLAEAKEGLATRTAEFLNGIRVASSAEREQRRIKGDIEDRQSYIRDYLAKVDEYKTQIEALRREYTSYCFNDNEDLSPATQLLPLIGADKCMRAVISGDSETIYVACVSPIVYWEQDEVAQWKNARNSQVWDSVRVVTSGRFQFMTQAKVGINFARGRISGGDLATDTIAIISEAPTLARHPHVARYSCFGNNEYDINQAIKDKKYDVAAAYINSCMMQLNLTDGCVVQTMSDYIHSNSDMLFFYDTVDNKYVSFDDALTILNSEGTTDEVH